MIETVESQEDELVRAIAQKERRLIIESLLQGSMNISQLAKKMGSDRATVAYHLGILEQAELVDSEYQMLKPPASMGKIGRFYRVKPSRLKQASQAFEKLSKDILKHPSP